MWVLGTLPESMELEGSIGIHASAADWINGIRKKQWNQKDTMELTLLLGFESVGYPIQANHASAVELERSLPSTAVHVPAAVLASVWN